MPSGRRAVSLGAAIAVLLYGADAWAEARMVELTDPAGDSAITMDWVSVKLRFDADTGAYDVLLRTDPAGNFQGDVRVNLSLLDPDTDPFAVDPSLFTDVLDDFSVLESGVHVLSDVSTKLTSWDVGDRVATSQIPFGSPPGAPSEFASALIALPGGEPHDPLDPLQVAQVRGLVATAVAAEGDLSGADRLSWGGLGGPFTAVATPFVLATDAGISVTVSKPSTGDFERRNQCAIGESFSTCGANANFAPGEELLFTNFASGPVRLEFAEPVAAVGAQLTSNEFAPYVAVVEAFGASGDSLGFFTQAGTGSSAADDSAAFVGIQTPVNLIHAVEFDVASGRVEFSMNSPYVARVVGLAPIDPRARIGLVALLLAGGLLATFRRSLSRRGAALRQG